MDPLDEKLYSMAPSALADALPDGYVPRPIVEPVLASVKLRAARRARLARWSMATAVVIPAAVITANSRFFVGIPCVMKPCCVAMTAFSAMLAGGLYVRHRGHARSSH
jgi:hypothetical protein